MFSSRFACIVWVCPLLFAACGTESTASSSTDDVTADTAGSDAAGACSAVHVITARASNETPGEGRTSALVDQIVAQSKEAVTRSAVAYPATLTGYANSSAAGVTALKAQLIAQVQACPNQKIVLAGYSQGAHVVLDVLGGGGGGALGALTDPVDSAVADHVTAVVTFADPRHVINQPYDKGTSLRNGKYPRTDAQLQVLSGLAAKIETFCDTDDLYCDSGTSLTVHQTYLARYQQTALDFVLGRVQ